MNIRIELNEPQILQKVTSDKFGLFVSLSWKKLLNPYTPRDTGLMMKSVKYRPWEIEYFQRYSAYMYFGEIYVDPIFNCSGFMTSEGWKSRFKVKKVPSGRKFNYGKGGTDHWDVKAAEAGQLDKLYRTLNDELQSGRI